MSVAMRAFLVGCALLAAAGCRVAEPHAAARSPLAPLAVSPETIALEVFTARAPQDDPRFDELWKLVDEQPLDAELRRRLAANGVRAALVGPQIPAPLAATLKLTDRRVNDEERQNAPIDSDTAVNLRVLQGRTGKRIELAIPGAREQMALLEAAGDGQVRGKNYRKPDCRLALRAFRENDGRVRIELTPEVHYGDFKSHVRGSDGMMLWTQERQKRIFSELRLDPVLAAGQMLLVTSRPGQSASAGHHFFTDTSGEKPRPTLWVIRVAQAAPDRAFFEGTTDDGLGAVSNDQEE